MAKRKVKTGEVETEREETIQDIVGRYIDPSEAQHVKIDGNTIIINSTQVSAEKIAGLAKELKDRDEKIHITSTHPDEAKL